MNLDAASSLTEPEASGALPPPVKAGNVSVSYREILKSSALIGGSTLVTAAIGIVRTKAMAVLLGPSGYGLMGAYLLIVELARNVAQFGVNASGVRQIAEAAGSGDLQRTARTAKVLRLVAWVSAIVGAACLALLAPVVSELTFGSALHADDVVLLSAALALSVIAGGQLALVQGMRRIGDLTRIGIVGAVVGAIASIALVYWLRERGVVPSLVALAAIAVVTGWWYRRKIVLPSAPLSVAQAWSESSSLLKLGLAFMASGLLVSGAAYIVRTLVLRHSGLEAAGLFQTAWTLGGLYIGFVLQAMSADFYPRLVASVADHATSNRLVNEQAQVSLLLAGPGVLATLTFAPLAIDLLYSARFSGAVDVLRWICLGMALRVVSWPMGYIIVAKNRQSLFFCTEMAWATVNVGLTWLCVESFGLNGAGMAFFASYVFHCGLIYPIVRRLTGFRWTPENSRLALAYALAIAATFVAFQTLPPAVAMTLGVIASLAAALHSAAAIARLGASQRIPGPLLRVLRLGGRLR